MLKAVLFDLDGTLLDTLEDIRVSLNEALAAYHYPLVSKEETRCYVGNGARRLVERALPVGADTEGVYAYFMRVYAESAYEHTRLFEGEREALNELAERYALAVVTNKPQRATEACIQKFFPPKMFGYTGGDSGMFPIKPNPTLARYTALTLRVAPCECVFVGDGETDVETAKNAGMHSIACLWGYRTKEQLLKAGATDFAESFSELEQKLFSFPPY